MNLWRYLQGGYQDFYERPPVKVDVALRFFCALVADIFLLALAFWMIYLWINRSSVGKPRKIVALLFLFALSMPLNILRREMDLFSPRHLVAVAGLVAAAVAIVLWHGILLRPVASVVLMTLPLLFIEIAASAWHIMGARSYQEPALARRLPGAVAPRRVVWVIFDELDQQLVFAARSPGLWLPALDGVRSESLYATNVYRAARNTADAIPSLLLGRTVMRSKPLTETDFNVTWPDGVTEPFPSRSSIFSLLRKRGVNSAIGGWYLPYCRLFSESVSDCVWAPAESNLSSIFISTDPPPVESTFKEMVRLARNQLEEVPGLVRLGLKYHTLTDVPVRARSVRQIPEYWTIYDAALRFSIDRGVGLVFLHFPVPHRYGIYDRRANRIQPGGNYYDNLALVDKTVAGLRQAMENAGLWDSTTILISSDHSLRQFTAGGDFEEEIEEGKFLPRLPVEPRLVPFLLKLPGQHTEVRYDTPFSAVLTSDLLLAILGGEISSPEQALEWLARNRRRVPVGG